MSITPLRFTGISSFSDDFQSIVDRTVSIANLPVQALQRDQLDLLQKKSAWTGVEAAVAGLSSKMAKLGNFGAGGSLSASSNSSKLSVSVSGTAQIGNWSVGSIDSLAQAASSTSTIGYSSSTTTSVTGGSNYLQLVVGGETYDINLGTGEDNLVAIRDRINDLGAGVSASLLYSGGDNPKYYLTLTASETGAQELALRTAKDLPATTIVSVNDPGSNAVVWVNGVKVERSSNVIDDALEGLTLTLKDESTDPVSISVTSNRSSITNALEGFVDAYNTLQTRLDEQSGDSAGMLLGDGLLRQIRGQLQSISRYEGTGVIKTFSDLGLAFDTNGVLSLDPSVIESMPASQVSGLMQFLGSESTGFSSLGKRLSDFSDPVSGLIQRQIDEYDQTDKRISARIEEMTDRISRMQETLLVKLQSADAMLARLDSQKSMLDASLESLNMVLYGKKAS